MTVLIIIIAVLIFVAGIVLLINPESIWGFLRTNINRTEIHVLAVLVRFLIGVLLLSQSNHSRYPVTIQILGLLSIIAAISLAVMGRGNFVKLMTWAVNTLKPFARVGGILALLFGAFIIFAFA